MPIYKQDIFGLIENEMIRQDVKWGSQRNLPRHLWTSILGEEFGEVCKATLESDPDNYVEELVQVAAVAIQAIYAVMTTPDKW